MEGKLILLTSTFPFGTGETFLETELPYLAQSFSEVIILPVKKASTDANRSIPKNCTINTSIISKKNNESSLARITAKLKTALTSSFFYTELVRVFPNLPDRDVVDNLLTYSRDVSLSKTAIRRILRSTEIDDEGMLMYSYWCNGATLGAILAQNKYPVVSRVHRADLYEELYTKNYIPFRKKTISAIDVLFSISEDGIQYLSERYTSEKSKFRLSRLGIPVPKQAGLAQDTVDPLIIVSCSNINENKRVDRIAHSLKYFALKYPDVSLNWNHFGAGSDLDKIENLTDEFPENLSAKLHGHVDNKALINWYSNHPVHLFMNLSKSEGIPVSIMEANSFGIPAVATNVGGTSELVNKESGWLLNQDFTDIEIQTTLEEALLNHSLRNQKAGNAYNMCLTHFDSGKNYPEFTKKLKDVMLRHHAQS